MKKIVVLYHANCPDGFSAAWAAWKKFGSRANYIPVNHQEPPPKGLKNRDVYVVDFSYPAATLRKLMKENKKVVVIDHHISAKENIKVLPEYSFNINHSGAVLAWKYFHPKKPIPRLLKHVEDADLWHFRLPHTEEISSFRRSLKFDFKMWSEFVSDLENSKKLREIIRQGKLLLRFEDKLVEKILQNAEVVKFERYKTMAVNSPIFESILGHELDKKMSPIGIVWHVKEKVIKVSLRSNGKVDVSKIAVKYGGGGHKSAAGFTLPRNAKLPWKVLKS